MLFITACTVDLPQVHYSGVEHCLELLVLVRDVALSDAVDELDGGEDKDTCAELLLGFVGKEFEQESERDVEDHPREELH